MTFHLNGLSALRMITLALPCALLAACTTSLLPPNVVPVAPPSQSVEQANRSLEQAAKDRAAIEARFATSEQVCYTKFFVNNCLDAAREQRRSTLAAVRAVEIEAEYYIRKAEADERDRALAKALQEDAAEAATRAAAPPRPEPQTEPVAPPRPAAVRVNRQAQQQEKLRRQAEKDRAEAPERAANVAKFERKQREAAERQRKLDEKKASQ